MYSKQLSFLNAAYFHCLPAGWRIHTYNIIFYKYPVIPAFSIYRDDIDTGFQFFDNFSRKRAISWAKQDLNNSRASYYYAKNDIARNVKTAYLNMKKSEEQLNVAAETEAAAIEDMALTQEKYNLGAATILELLQAQEDLIGAQNKKINAEFDYNFAVATLENAMGVR